jgi:hypothetical protein
VIQNPGGESRPGNLSEKKIKATGGSRQKAKLKTEKRRKLWQ